MIDAHYTMLADKRRLDAYQRAIDQVVQSGDKVVDLGAGTGILSMMAVRAGAEKVYAIEQTELADYAEDIIRLNSMSEKISLINRGVESVQLPEKVDILIGEIIGMFGVEENLTEVYNHAVANFLKPNGKVIPNSLTLWVAPIQSSRIRKLFDFWENIAGFDYSIAIESVKHSPVYEYVAEDSIVCSPKMIANIDLCRQNETDLNAAAEFHFNENAEIDGFCGWFEANLSPGIALDNSVFSPKTHWRQIVFPIVEPQKVTRGDSVDLRITTTHFGKNIHFNWFANFSIGKKTIRRKHARFLGQKPPEKLKEWFPGKVQDNLKE